MATKLTPFRLDDATLDRLRRKGLPMAAQLRLDVATAVAWEQAEVCECCRAKLLLLRADTTIAEAAKGGDPEVQP
jgi:hypothetical protein